MTKVEKYVQEAINIANDNSHGYSQKNRNGCPDYDCSSMVCAIVDNAGIPVKSKGASYTGNMYEAFIMCGFKDVKCECNMNTGAGLVRGDILLNRACHTCVYIGDGKVVNARTDTDGCCGDSHGDEIRIQSYWNYNPWDHVLRYCGDEDAVVSAVTSCASAVVCEAPSDSAVGCSSANIAAVCIPSSGGNNPNYPEIIKYGDAGEGVADLQTMLNALGYNCGTVDGEFGKNTLAALKKFQQQKGLEVDGEAGPITMCKLIEYYHGFTGKDKARETITVSAFDSDAPRGSAPDGVAPDGSCGCNDNDTLNVGDEVIFSGSKHYIGADFNVGSSCKPGKAKVTAIKLGRKHPVHLVRIAGEGSTVYGWVDLDDVRKA